MLVRLLVLGVTFTITASQYSGEYDYGHYDEYVDQSTRKPASTSKPKPTGKPTTVKPAPGACTKKVKWAKKSKSTVTGFDLYKVFGVHAFCETGGNKTDCQHMLSVLASYLDNDNDGCIENPPEFLKNINSAKLDSQGVEGRGALILTKKMGFQMPPGFEGKYYGLTMWEDETKPECSGTKSTENCIDASQEEVFHLLTDAGYGPTWPKVFGLLKTSNSNLTRAMDKARGGRLLTPPWKYSKKAWYKHDESSCGYDRCQTTEYHWNAYASYAGISKNRKMTYLYGPNTPDKMKKQDPDMYKILSDTKTGYRTPKVAPTGTYTGCAVCKATTGDKTSHGGII